MILKNRNFDSNFYHRIFGLDILRSLAIIMVMVSHYPLSDFSFHLFGFSIKPLLGTLSVEIFFCLSGFLMLFRSKQQIFSGRWQASYKYILRRWFRTLPLYYLTIVIAVILSWASKTEIPDLFQFLTLSQNIFDGGREQFHNWFGVSWSLTVEEWFYLIFPVSIFLLMKIQKTWMFYFFIFVFSLLGRLYYSLHFPECYFDECSRRVAILRFDALAWGCVAFEIFKRYEEKIQGFKMIAVGAVLVCGLTYLFPVESYKDNNFGLRFWLMQLLPMAMIPVTIGFAKIKVAEVARINLIRIMVTWLATRAYALYLLHDLIWDYFLNRNEFLFAKFIIYILPITLIAAECLFRFVERPSYRMLKKYVN